MYTECFALPIMSNFNCELPCKNINARFTTVVPLKALLVQPHNMTTVKEIIEQCRQL